MYAVNVLSNFVMRISFQKEDTTMDYIQQPFSSDEMGCERQENYTISNISLKNCC